MQANPQRGYADDKIHFTEDAPDARWKSAKCMAYQ